jgi:hypothetical protein
MTPTCHKAVRSFRAIARLNLIQALSATIAAKPILTSYHRQSYLDFRASARRLQLTSI